MALDPNKLLDGSIDDVRERLKQVDAHAGEEILQRIIMMINDIERPDVVRAEAAMAIGRCSTEECRLALQALLVSDNPTLRQLAVTGLGEDQDDRSIRWIVDMLADSVNKVRNVAERALLKRDAQMARCGIEPLLKLLEHPVPLTRSPAARLLGHTQDRQALEPLLNMLESQDWLERMWAAKSLGDLGQPEAVAPLIAKLQQDEKNRVRAACADALGTLRPENVEDILKTAARNDEDEGVRKTAHEAILALGFEADEFESDPFADDD